MGAKVTLAKVHLKAVLVPSGLYIFIYSDRRHIPTGPPPPINFVRAVGDEGTAVHVTMEGDELLAQDTVHFILRTKKEKTTRVRVAEMTVRNMRVCSVRQVKPTKGERGWREKGLRVLFSNGFVGSNKPRFDCCLCSMPQTFSLLAVHLFSSECASLHKIDIH